MVPYFREVRKLSRARLSLFTEDGRDAMKGPEAIHRVHSVGAGAADAWGGDACVVPVTCCWHESLPFRRSGRRKCPLPYDFAPTKRAGYRRRIIPRCISSGAIDGSVLLFLTGVVGKRVRVISSSGSSCVV